MFSAGPDRTLYRTLACLQAAAPPMQQYQINEAQLGQRLDQTIAALAGFSVGAARRLLSQGGVHLNGRVAGLSQKGRLMRGGEVIQMRPEDPNAAEPLVDAGIQLPMLARSNGGLIVAKPAGMPVHPLEPQERGTVLNALLAHLPVLSSVGEGGLRGGVVHRLDVGTSGALALALDQATWHKWREAMTGRTAIKRYLAVAAGSGRPPGEGGALRQTAAEAQASRDGASSQIACQGGAGPGITCREESRPGPPSWREMSAWLALGSHAPARVRVVAASPQEAQARSLPAGARRCVQRWRLLHTWPDEGGWRALIAVDLLSGFLHQIRVMLAHRGMPLVGDDLYAPPEVAVRAERPMLHAAFLAIGGLSAAAPWPEDFTEAVTGSGGPAEGEIQLGEELGAGPPEGLHPATEWASHKIRR